MPQAAPALKRIGMSPEDTYDLHSVGPFHPSTKWNAAKRQCECWFCVSHRLRTLRELQALWLSLKAPLASRIIQSERAKRYAKETP